MPRKKKEAPFDQARGVREIARERVGIVPPTRPIEPKSKRKKPKYKLPPGEEA